MRVLAMAYGGRPLERLAVGRGKGVIYLSTDNSNESPISNGVGFPENCVFEFERELFHSLQHAWLSQNEEALEHLWAKATPLREPDKIAA
jgi:hypothetical protein